MSRKKDFDDVQELRNGSLGVLGGEGSDFLEKVKTEVKPEGIVSTCPCGQCGRPQEITVEWPEAVVGSLKLLAPNWNFDEPSGNIYANVGCGSCNYQLKLLFSPNELKRHIMTAIQQGDVNPQDIARLVADTKQAAGLR
jgi:hypothetical protein